jgi:hypothetical protein
MPISDFLETVQEGRGRGEENGRKARQAYLACQVVHSSLMRYWVGLHALGDRRGQDRDTPGIAH